MKTTSRKSALCPICHSRQTKKKYSIGKFSVIACKSCLNAFTYPLPKNISEYYQQYYWIPPGILGSIKNYIFTFFQKRRYMWLISYLKSGDILEIGAGEGLFLKSLPKNFRTIGLDAPDAKIKNPGIVKADFLRWQNSLKFDGVIFWESLEHVPNPQKYIAKVGRMLRHAGYIFIEYPKFDSLESKIFGSFWFHLDLPRHTSHFTEEGLSRLLEKNKFSIVHCSDVPAFEYSIIGLSLSIMKIFRLDLTNEIKKVQGILYLVMLVPLLLVSSVIVLILYCRGKSSIGLIIAKHL